MSLDTPKGFNEEERAKLSSIFAINSLITTLSNDIIDAKKALIEELGENISYPTHEKEIFIRAKQMVMDRQIDEILSFGISIEEYLAGIAICRDRQESINHENIIRNCLLLRGEQLEVVEDLIDQMNTKFRNVV